MIIRNRVIWSDNGVLKDISDVINNHISGTSVIPLVAADDYIYVGSDAPFNHRWVEVSVANTAASKVAVDIWDGRAWKACVEVIDQTLDSTGTKTLSKSGRIIWVPDRDEPSWSLDDTKTSNSVYITGLQSITIYDLYWARFRFTADLSLTTALAFLGYKFVNDEDLQSYYPELALTEAKARFKTGITTWDQVHFEAAKEVTRELKSTQVISSDNQIIDWDVLRIPAIHKAAELIYAAYGVDWKDYRDASLARFKESMRVKTFYTDINSNATLDQVERNFEVGRMNR